MNKAWLGLILGGILGVFDGLTAWFYPEARPQIAGIIIGSTFKGLIAGVIIGAFARKVNSLPIGILFGLGVGLVLAFAVAAMPNPAGKHYYFEIMLPGGIVGMIVGYATQRFGRGAQPARPQSA
jgi:peptidoglycan/LPS O-acetylase OafA/YrhL